MLMGIGFSSSLTVILDFLVIKKYNDFVVIKK